MNIKDARLIQNKYSPQQIAKVLQMPLTDYLNYEANKSDIRQLPAEQVAILADWLHVTMDDIVREAHYTILVNHKTIIKAPAYGAFQFSDDVKQEHIIDCNQIATAKHILEELSYQDLKYDPAEKDKPLKYSIAFLLPTVIGDKKDAEQRALIWKYPKYRVKTDTGKVITATNFGRAKYIADSYYENGKHYIVESY